MSKKVPISLNKENQRKISELEDLMNIVNTYGSLPKAVKFGINLAVSAIKNPNKVYADLDEDEMAIYFQSVQRAETKARMLKKAEELKKSAQKV